MFLDELGLAALRERRHRKAAAAAAEVGPLYTLNPVDA
jgi:hypothetical protein